MNLTVFLCILVFLIGLYFYAKNSNSAYFENFTGTNGYRCPNLLIQKGANYFLYNTQLAEVPGVNPIEFENLEDYSEFLDWQRSQNIRCPVLYLQQTYDAQGNRIYKTRPSVYEVQAGLPPSIASSSGNMIHEGQEDTELSNKPPLNNYTNVPPTQSVTNKYINTTLLTDAGRNDPPYNMNSYPAQDPSNFNIGENTPLDDMNTKQQTAKISPNPMDSNWGGASYTQSLVDKGYYKYDEVSIFVTS